MANFTGAIYCTTDKTNGKVYIGQTNNSNPSYLGGGVLLKIVMKKYGRHNFNKVILISNIESIEELNYLEKFYISLYNSTDKEIGYNIRTGGENKAFKHTPEAIEKIRERSNKNDNKIRIRRIQKISVKARIGLHHSNEVKIKMMNTKFGVMRQIEIYDIKGDLLHTCNFSPEASKFTGVKRAGIANNLCGLAKSAGGYIFTYKSTN